MTTPKTPARAGESRAAKAANAALRRDAAAAAAPPAIAPPPFEPEDRFVYLKNLMTKYLGTAAPDAREHMERAVMMVLGYADDEKARILADRDASGAGLAPAGLAAWWG